MLVEAQRGSFEKRRIALKKALTPVHDIGTGILQHARRLFSAQRGHSEGLRHR
jgi:hypothetical protein